MKPETPSLRVRVHSITHAADGVLFFDLRPADGHALPAFDAGAHVSLHLPGGMIRSYSLMNRPDERHRYLLGIKREEAGRGGSAWLHDVARVGTVIAVDPPLNHFALDERAAHSVLFAGGIGITPLWSMVQRLQDLGASWELHFRARSRVSAVLVEELGMPSLRPYVHLGFSDEPGARRLDMARIVAAAPTGAHFYCCGPAPMVDSFQTACAGIDPSRVHFEYFASKEAPATEGGYSVRLARSGKVIPVLPGRTILDSLQACGVAVPSSCQQGVCGACETRVIAGTPDHRDLVLSDAEKATGQTMMICCSGSLTAVIELDL